MRGLPPKEDNLLVSLICMRLEEMELVHPEMVEDVCDLCSTTVGIYPSGQNVLSSLGRDAVEVTCNHCYKGEPGMPAPGAFKEIGQSILNPKNRLKS